uniref:Uncharacterized protein n=1 Tax=Taeniopygia guttata TaxID=59729 RepID=A0A674GCY7_TAEGU
NMSVAIFPWPLPFSIRPTVPAHVDLLMVFHFLPHHILCISSTCTGNHTSEDTFIVSKLSCGVQRTGSLQNQLDILLSLVLILPTLTLLHVTPEKPS